MKRFFLQLLNILISLSIFFIFPFYMYLHTGNSGQFGWMCLTWLPALLCLYTLNDEIEKIK
jgi:hypothetical protein